MSPTSASGQNGEDDPCIDSVSSSDSDHAAARLLGQEVVMGGATSNLPCQGAAVPRRIIKAVLLVGTFVSLGALLAESFNSRGNVLRQRTSKVWQRILGYAEAPRPSASGEDSTTATAFAAALSRARERRRADAWREPFRRGATSTASATWESDHTWQWRWPDGKHFMLWHPPIPAPAPAPGSAPAGETSSLPADMTGNDISITNPAPNECILCRYWADNAAPTGTDIHLVHYEEGLTLPCADLYYEQDPTNPHRFAAGTGGCDCAQAVGGDPCPDE